MFIREERDEEGARGLFSRRALVLGLAQTIGFGVLAGRLYQLQVMEGNRFAPLADTNRITMHGLAPVRGRIFDRSGVLLADNAEGFRLLVTPSLSSDLRALLQTVQNVVPLEDAHIETLIARARRQSANVPLVVAEPLTFQQVAKLSVLAPQWPGLATEPSGRRRYFQGDTMGHLIGHVGRVERFALDDDPVLRLPGMRVGKIGAERGHEETLRGVGGWVKREVDARGRVVRDLERVEPRGGRDIVLTVDTELQRTILDRFRQIRRGAAVALRVDTGELMAMASWPTANVSDIGDGITQAQWDALSGRRGDPLFNRAIQGLYPPGSTFKMITALAALEAGEVSLRERITCRGSYRLADQRYRCWNRRGHGPCDLHRALRESCDVYFYEIAHRIGISKIAAMARKFGLGETYDALGVAFQKPGVIPTPAWKRGHLGQNWFGGETLIGGIGQGYVSTTPLQLAVMTARLATGRAVTPRAVRPGPGEAWSEFETLDVDPAHLRAVRRAMWAVVHERAGTGKAARLDEWGPEVAGKTGTSQVTRLSSQRAKDQLPWHLRDHALFVSYVPANAPRYAVSVVVEHGGSGGKVAAPLARQIMADLIAFERREKAPFVPKSHGQDPAAAHAGLSPQPGEGVARP